MLSVLCLDLFSLLHSQRHRETLRWLEWLLIFENCALSIGEHLQDGICWRSTDGRGRAVGAQSGVVWVVFDVPLGLNSCWLAEHRGVERSLWISEHETMNSALLLGVVGPAADDGLQSEVSFKNLIRDDRSGALLVLEEESFGNLAAHELAGAQNAEVVDCVEGCGEHRLVLAGRNINPQHEALFP